MAKVAPITIAINADNSLFTSAAPRKTDNPSDCGHGMTSMSIVCTSVATSSPLTARPHAAAIRTALEAAGVEFIPENGG
jgi:hypothetical protein